jgi:signal transduction histidine kinase
MHVLSELANFTGFGYYRHCIDQLRLRVEAAILYVTEPAATFRSCALPDRTLSLLAVSTKPDIVVTDRPRQLRLSECESGIAITGNEPRTWVWDSNTVEPIGIAAPSPYVTISVGFALGASGDRAALTACFLEATDETYRRVTDVANAVGLVHDYIQERKSHQLTDSLARLLIADNDQAGIIMAAIDNIRTSNRLCSVTFAFARSSAIFHTSRGPHHNPRSIHRLLEHFRMSDEKSDVVFLPDLRHLERDGDAIQLSYPDLPTHAFAADRERFQRSLTKTQGRREPTISDLTLCLRGDGEPLALVRMTGTISRPYAIRQREVSRIAHAAPLLQGIAQRTMRDLRREAMVKSLSNHVGAIQTLNKEIRQNAIGLRRDNSIGGAFELGRVAADHTKERHAKELADVFYRSMLAHVATAISGADILSIRTLTDPSTLHFVHFFGDAWEHDGTAEIRAARIRRPFPLTNPPTSAGAEVFLTGEPRFVGLPGQGRHRHQPFDPTFPTRSAAYVPIQAGPMTIGVLDVRSSDHELTLEDTAACEILGQVIGLTVELRSSIQDEISRSTVHVKALEDLNHQIKTPLGLVMKRADLTVDVLDDYSDRFRLSTGQRWKPQDHVMFLRAVAANALRVAQSVSSYVELATYGKLNPRRERTMLSTLRLKIVGVVRDAGLLASEDAKTIRMEDAVKGHPVEGRTVELSLDYFQQVLQQVLDNALKYAWEGSQILVRFYVEKEEFRMSISSRGVRVPPFEEERVFERNYRAQAAVDAAEAGSGIGLWIVRAIVESAGGVARLVSNGDRTTVSISLPLTALA